MKRHDRNGPAVLRGPGGFRIVVRGILLAAVAVCAAGPARAQYTFERSTLAGGGGQVGGGPYALDGTIGQPDANELTGGSYVLGGGFWGGGVVQVVGIDDETDRPAGIPLLFQLHAAAPNPMIRGTVLRFDLPEPRFIRLHVYDVAGRRARTLAEETLPAGRHQRAWNGTDDAGQPVEVGMYFVRFEAEEFQARQKIVVVK